MNTHARPLLGLCVLAALLSSCAHRIQYPLTDSDRWSTTRIPHSVKVQQFKDNAPKDDKINVNIGGKTWRVNGRDGYADPDISVGISDMIANHLKHSGLFERVLGPKEPGRAELVLEGEIYDFNAMGEAKMAAETAVVLGSAFGSLAGAAIAGAATMPVRTDVVSTVELRNVELKDANSGRRVWSRESIRRSDRERKHFIHADAPHVYKRADRQLKQVVGDLVGGLGASRVAQPASQTGGTEPETLLAATSQPKPAPGAPTADSVAQSGSQPAPRPGLRNLFRQKSEPAPVVVASTPARPANSAVRAGSSLAQARPTQPAPKAVGIRGLTQSIRGRSAPQGVITARTSATPSRDRAGQARTSFRTHVQTTPEPAPRKGLRNMLRGKRKRS